MLRSIAITCLACVPTAALAGVDESWQEQATANLARAEYSASQTAAGLQAPNRAHNLRTTFGERGIDIVPRVGKNEAPAWRFAWQTSGLGRSASLQSVVASAPQANANHVTYAHDGWSEWYENTAEGLEQGFTIERRPSGEGALRIAGEISCGLEPRTRDDGAVDFIDDHGASVIRYAELHVWDAHGTELPAEIAVAQQTLSIVIDDHAAVYPITVDPVMTSPAWTTESDQASALLGFSVATAGDVNGDGFSDVIVGAWGYDNGQTDEGRAYVYHGSASGLSLTANWTVEADVGGALLGYCVASAGDVNGDGFDDVIVGASRWTNGSTNEGRALVYHGSASGPSLTPNWTAESDQANAEFGTEVASAGDVNGDGFADVIVGSPYFDNGQSDEGRAFVYHGSASGLSPAANWTAESNVIGVQFGNSVATAGDVNGDGFADVIVGTWLFSNGQSNEGRASVFLGSASGLAASADQHLEGNQNVAYFGSSVAGAGDVNGDGFADVIVGAPGYSNGQSSEGRAFVYHGSATGVIPIAAWTAEPNQGDTAFGQSVGTAGDVNGDGYADVIVGAHNWTNGQAAEGRADVYEGSATGLSSTAAWTAEGNQANAGFGVSVATAGDVNGDGYSDVIVGAWAFSNGQASEGRAFVYLGSTKSLPSAASWTAQNEQGGSDFGVSVASAGDVNGDGYSDVIIGARLYDDGQSNEGRVFVYHGSRTGLSLVPDWSVESDEANAWFGESVACAGDVNGDGYSDVIVGAPLSTGDQAQEGRAFVFHGSSTGLSTTPAWIAEGNQTNSDFGHSVATAGDVNGDGFSDVIVGAWFANNFDGRAYVYHGSAAGLATSPAWTRDSGLAGARYGASVSTAGDVNGDGFSDVIVGANFYTNGQVEEGAAFVYHGSVNGLSLSPNWLAEGGAAGSELGFSVSTAGDVNGDGFSDVIVGAYLRDAGQTDEGRAYAYYGSPSGLSVSSQWVGESDQTDAWYGYSVASAGDVNGDGYGDVIIGAPNYPGAQFPEGRIFVHHGSATGLAIAPSQIVSTLQPFIQLGYSVASAGDVNGDGFSDMIAGCPGFFRAMTYYGNESEGLDRIPRQAQLGDTAPIASLGTSDSPTGFLLKALGRTPAGRGRVRLQYEVKPNGIPFNGSGLVTGSELDTGAPVAAIGSTVALAEAASGLSAGSLYRWRLRILSDSPLFPHSRWLAQPANGVTEADVRTRPATTGVADVASVIGGLRLEPGAPNPFAVATRLAYTLPNRGWMRLAVFDVSGRRIAVLADGLQEAGRHVVTWNGRDQERRSLAAGVYFARLEFDGHVEGKKLLLMR